MQTLVIAKHFDIIENWISKKGLKFGGIFMLWIGPTGNSIIRVPNAGIWYNFFYSLTLFF